MGWAVEGQDWAPKGQHWLDSVFFFSLREERGILLQDSKNIHYLLLGYVATVASQWQEVTGGPGPVLPCCLCPSTWKASTKHRLCKLEKVPYEPQGREEVAWAWKDRGDQTTLDPILRPQSAGLNCAGCQPLTTRPALKALAVPVNCLWLTNSLAETTPQSPHLPCHCNHHTSVL